jgi:hypothetical protein
LDRDGKTLMNIVEGSYFKLPAMDPALVYAMNNTGRIVTQQNMRFLTDADIQEWNDAVDEYHQMILSGDTQ